MTSAAVTVAGTIVSILALVVGTYLAARSNARENERVRQAAIDKAVADAKAPLIADNARLSSDKAQLLIDNQRLNNRVTQLEDRLYGGGRPRP